MPKEDVVVEAVWTAYDAARVASPADGLHPPVDVDEDDEDTPGKGKRKGPKPS